MRTLFFDCFGTLFNMENVPKEDVAAYVKQVKAPKWQPLCVPVSFLSIRPHDDFVDGMIRLRKRYEVCAFSNSPEWLTRHILESDENVSAACKGTIFNDIIPLEACRVYKPRPEAMAFAMGWRQLRVDDRPLVVTANPTFGDIEMSRSFGIDSIVIRHGFPNDLFELADYLDSTDVAVVV